MRRLAGNGPLETRKVTEARVLLPLGEGLNSFKIYSILFNSRVRTGRPSTNNREWGRLLFSVSWLSYHNARERDYRIACHNSLVSFGESRRKADTLGRNLGSF